MEMLNQIKSNYLAAQCHVNKASFSRKFTLNVVLLNMTSPKCEIMQRCA